MEFEGLPAVFTLYIVPAVLMAGLVLFVSRRILAVPKWYRWEPVLIVFPGVVYCVLDSFPRLGEGKSLGNLSEPILVAIAYGFVLMIRAIGGHSHPPTNKHFAIIAPIVGVLLAILVFFLMPSLPE